MAEPIVAARDIHKHFGTLHVLKGVDLTVAERELVFVIGPSGSGKSTLLNLIAGIDKPSAGEILVAGVDIAQLSEGELAHWRAMLRLERAHRRVRAGPSRLAVDESVVPTRAALTQASAVYLLARSPRPRSRSVMPSSGRPRMPSFP